jgi:hypothetical protein
MTLSSMGDGASRACELGSVIETKHEEESRKAEQALAASRDSYWHRVQKKAVPLQVDSSVGTDSRRDVLEHEAERGQLKSGLI